MDIERKPAHQGDLYSTKSEAEQLAIPTLAEDRNATIQLAYRRALPAFARVVNINTEALRAKLFDAMSDVAHVRDAAIAEVERMCEEVTALIKPHHAMANTLSPTRAIAELRRAVVLRNAPGVIGAHAAQALRDLAKAPPPSASPSSGKERDWRNLDGAEAPPTPAAKTPAAPKKRAKKNLKGMGKGFFQHSDAKVRKARKMIRANKLTKKAIALELGMSEGYVYGIASGKVRPDIE